MFPAVKSYPLKSKVPDIWYNWPEIVVADCNLNVPAAPIVIFTKTFPPNSIFHDPEDAFIYIV